MPELLHFHALCHRPSLHKTTFVIERAAYRIRRVGQAQAIAVTGPGDSGKTRLLLRFIKEYEGKYHIILWIDAQTEGTVRSSHDRCCRALSLPVDGTSADAPPYFAARMLKFHNH